MKQISTLEVILIGCAILALFITIPLILNYLDAPKINILPPLVSKREVSIVGINVESPDNITFYTDGVMTKAEKKLMVESFLTAIVIPEKDLKVNLQMGQQDNIAQFYLGRTELGRVMLEQDLLLKKCTSTAYYPEKEPGYTFWNRVNTYGSRVASSIKVWICSKKVVVKDDGKRMFIKQADLDVKQERLREGVSGFQEVSDEIILPEIKRYVLNDEHFAQTRQVFRAVICGIWFKNKFLHTLYHYSINTNKVGYFEIADTKIKYTIYEKWLKSFKDYDYPDTTTTGGDRRWGGVEFMAITKQIKVEKEDITEDLRNKDSFAFKTKPTTIPTSVDTEQGVTIKEIGGIDLEAKIEIEEEALPVSDLEAREWQLSESIGYDLLN